MSGRCVCVGVFLGEYCETDNTDTWLLLANMLHEHCHNFLGHCHIHTWIYVASCDIECIYRFILCSSERFVYAEYKIFLYLQGK